MLVVGLLLQVHVLMASYVHWSRVHSYVAC